MAKHTDNSWLKGRTFGRILTNQQVNKPCAFPQPLQSQMPEIRRVNFENVLSKLKKLFKDPIPNILLRERLKFFRHNLELLARDQRILDIILVYKIPFLREPTQNYLPEPGRS